MHGGPGFSSPRDRQVGRAAHAAVRLWERQVRASGSSDRDWVRGLDRHSGECGDVRSSRASRSEGQRLASIPQLRQNADRVVCGAVEAPSVDERESEACVQAQTCHRDHPGVVARRERHDNCVDAFEDFTLPDHRPGAAGVCRPAGHEQGVAVRRAAALRRLPRLCCTSTSARPESGSGA